MTGTVYLVGAGPGDPGLLTLRAAELLRSADVLVYDALVSPAILELVQTEERVFVGKRRGFQARTQDETNAILVELAGRFRRVVRLKGGDPFVFGRGGEEALVLANAGVPFEIVPGVTAGIAAPAYAGIPVTQRGMAASVAFVTGHEDPEKSGTDVDWAHLARGVGTVVFYMGVGRMEENFRRLVEAGRPSDTPAAVIEWGTYPRQRTVVGTLDTLPALAVEAGIGAPSLIVVGQVASLRERLAWWDRRPLSGKRIVVTRARAQASGFAAELTALGAEVVQFPTIRVVPPADPAPLRDAVGEIESFGWIVFTSANAVERFWDALAASGRDARALSGVRICAVGPGTAAALNARGIRADVVPSESLGTAAAEALLAEGPVDGVRILLPRAEAAGAELPARLRDAGAEVVDVAVYATAPDATGADEVRALLAGGQVDAVAFTAGSTVRNFVQAAGAELGGARVASIGPVTSAAARELGLTVDIEAGEHTIDGLVAALRNAFASRTQES
ncbi:uroporphyrinogen-III C-methyltransferase [Longimicrobium terrae]|uniref:uroporphyrinogen-III C-methyltransferase n=1 Tax=Longimicrobium terrae TaxID=1639882 RepID=A0A841GJ90_9BACT|nr:uroporphyrinogen III methyltransferase/synthase [Longimicrobium terrae]MBB6068627.1 uroporphyrinogen III methyltransferase/synthase [Longimicrobium terrae]NNC27813.1 uroporphyrinogen-III C-methyltransferase [Longimicrobium terrae]